MDLSAQIAEIAVALLITVGVLLACAWLVKRTQSGGLMRSTELRVISSLSLGTKERLVVVELGDAQIALGVTPSSVVLLKELDQPIISPTSPVGGFADVLKGVANRG